MVPARNDWLQRRGIDPRRPRWQERLRQLPDVQQDEFHNSFSRKFLEHLDCGHGECPLKRAELAAIVAENLRHFDGQRYLLADLAVMPNHVHLLACLLGDTDIEEQCYSWKKYEATQIDRMSGDAAVFGTRRVSTTSSALPHTSNIFDVTSRRTRQGRFAAGRSISIGAKK